MGVFLPNLESIRRIDWARSWHWDIQFPDAPEPFKKWFPAIDVDENLGTVDEYNFTAGFSSYNVPKSSQGFTLSVTFPDNSELVLENWFSDWINKEIFKSGRGGATYIATVASCSKEVKIAKLAPANRLISLNTYLVFPTGNLNYRGSSSAEIHSNTVEFKIAAILDKRHF